MIGVIADDLSGAAELAAVGWRRGLRTEILLNGRCGDAKDLVCVDTNSRGCNATEAQARVRGAVRALMEAGAKGIYKKVDSVLRGNVMVEARAIMEELNFPQALLVPANPSLGRVIRDGQYFVRGEWLHETEFARDPHYPRATSTISELLPGARVRKAADLWTDTGITVGEAETAEDLRAWASRKPAGTLLGGAAEFFAALLEDSGLRITGNQIVKGPASFASVAGELFVCGSTSESSLKFIEEARLGGAAVFSLPGHLTEGGEFSPSEMEVLAARAVEALAQRRVILNIGLPLVREPEIAQSLARHLVALASRVLDSKNVNRLYAEGGETAATLARKRGWGRLEVLQELAPGVVTTKIGGSEPLQFTLKPGTYQWSAMVRRKKCDE